MRQLSDDPLRCDHCGDEVTLEDSALAPNGFWCEPCFHVISELTWMSKTGGMPEWPMRYGPRMEVWPWWETFA